MTVGERDGKRSAAASGRQHREGGDRDLSTAGAITYAVNLQTVALRAGKRVALDSDAMQITHAPEANP